MKKVKNKTTVVKKRCAIYTRKSSEEGLEQEFNSLHAQRDAGEAYINSQKHEGWVLMPDYYDDGGFSGGNVERPALQRLVRDVKAGLIDIVVVYKVDRLSRSLADFALLVDLFDKHEVSFVSVTQQFNTTSSMGRLTLNILLSFAQFEREVTSERIRDKFLLSKKKGMWMGGNPPLGYDVNERKLTVNEKEAELVKLIFRTFVKTRSIIATCETLNQKGYKTKAISLCMTVRYGEGCPLPRIRCIGFSKTGSTLAKSVTRVNGIPANTQPLSPWIYGPKLMAPLMCMPNCAPESPAPERTRPS